MSYQTIVATFDTAAHAQAALSGAEPRIGDQRSGRHRASGS
jgi:hypothetical protein